MFFCIIIPRNITVGQGHDTVLWGLSFMSWYQDILTILSALTAFIYFIYFNCFIHCMSKILKQQEYFINLGFLLVQQKT